MSSTLSPALDQSADGPRVSLLVPVYRTPLDLLEAMVGSVLAQSASGWQLVLVDDGSAVAELAAALADYGRDPRITVIAREANGGIVAASADALHAATGEFVGLLDHDDLLHPEALRIVLETIDRFDDVDVVYTDERHIDLSGSWISEFRKPDWSPERLRSQMYLGHLAVYRRSLVEAVGGFRAGFDGSQDYDLALRVTEVARRIEHVPLALYSWRIHATSVSHAAGNDAVFDAARAALTEHLERAGIEGWVEQIGAAGVYRVHRAVQGSPTVSIVIPTRGGRAIIGGVDRCMVVEAVRSIVDRTTYPHFELVVVADEATPPEVLDELATIAGDRLVVVPWTEPFNFAAKMNVGAITATGDYLLALNDDVELLTEDWLETLLGIAQQPGVGLVGCLLLFEDGRVQHGGQIYEGGNAGHAAFGWPQEFGGPMAGMLVEREVSGVTAACSLMARGDFLALGGYSLDFPNNYNDVDFCLKVRSSGRRIVWTPHVRLFHYESMSRKSTVEPYELETIRARWGRMMRIDPYWFHFELPESTSVE